MQTSFLKLFDKPSDSASAGAASVGFACKLMAASTVHAQYNMAYVHRIIAPAMRHRCIKFYFNSRGEAVGYVIWAHVAPDVENEFLKSGAWTLHISEWNEGDSLWIVDLVAPFGHINEILQDLRDVVFPSHQSIRYFRVKGSKAISKEVSRHGHCHFFRSKSGGAKQ